jgi:hypothetical protein
MTDDDLFSSIKFEITMNLKVFYLYTFRLQDRCSSEQSDSEINWYRNKYITFVGQIAKQQKSKNGCNFNLGWNAFFQIFLQIFQKHSFN